MAEYEGYTITIPKRVLRRTSKGMILTNTLTKSGQPTAVKDMLKKPLIEFKEGQLGIKGKVAEVLDKTELGKSKPQVVRKEEMMEVLFKGNLRGRPRKEPKTQEQLDEAKKRRALKAKEKRAFVKAELEKKLILDAETEKAETARKVMTREEAETFKKERAKKELLEKEVKSKGQKKELRDLMKEERERTKKLKLEEKKEKAEKKKTLTKEVLEERKQPEKRAIRITYKNRDKDKAEAEEAKKKKPKKKIQEPYDDLDKFFGMKKSQEEKRIASNLRLKERRAKEKTQEEKDAQRIASNLRLKERRAKIREKIKKDAFKK
jgi:hypothetical protein